MLSVGLWLESDRQSHYNGNRLRAPAEDCKLCDNIFTWRSVMFLHEDNLHYCKGSNELEKVHLAEFI